MFVFPLFPLFFSHCRYPTLSYRINDLLVSETTHAFLKLHALSQPNAVDAHVFVGTYKIRINTRLYLQPGLYGTIDLLRLDAIRYHISVQQRRSNNTSRSQRYYRVGITWSPK
jgi:hypothetical protein